MEFLIMVSVLLFTVNSFATKPLVTKEADITTCQKNSDCIIVSYKHCCGATKKAINKKFLAVYKSTPIWQKFDNPEICAVAGQCLSDENVKETTCEAGQCQLRYPN